MRAVALIALLVAAVIAVAALPFDERHAVPAEPQATKARDAGPSPAPRATPPPVAGVPRARCPADVPGCRAVRGRVMYVERVDPDGDGDLHVVVLDGSVTAPGMTAVDVRAGLRPQRDPRIGERVSAAGPVQPGSYGQRQIHALEFHAG